MVILTIQYMLLFICERSMYWIVFYLQVKTEIRSRQARALFYHVQGLKQEEKENSVYVVFYKATTYGFKKLIEYNNYTIKQ